MPSNTCQAVTRKGKACKNKSVDQFFCKVHGGVGAAQKPAAVTTSDNTAQSTTPDTTKTFELIVQSGANLVNALEQAINYIPSLMENIFKYTGAQLMAPSLSEKMQKAATDRAKKRLQKLQMDFINSGSDPEKLDQLLEKTKRLEKMAIEAVRVGDKYMPSQVKNEIVKALNQLHNLRKSE
jgi:hypothetical protein